MKNKNILAILLIAVVVILAIVFSTKNNNSKYVVKIGHIKGTILTLPGEMIKSTDILRKHGFDYEIIDMASSNQAYEAVVRGDIDILPLVSFLPVMQNYEKQPDAVKIFATTQINIEDKYDQILVKNNSSIKTLSDMSGKKLKYGVFPGTTHTIFTKRYLESQGINISSIEFIQLPPTSHVQSLISGAIDVLGTYDPMATTGLATGEIRSVGYSVYAHDFPNTPLAGGLVNTKFAKSYPGVMKKFFSAYDDVYNTIINSTEITYDIIAKTYNFTPEVAKTIPLPKFVATINFNPETLQQLVDHLVEIKEIQKGFDVNSIIIR